MFLLCSIYHEEIAMKLYWAANTRAFNALWLVEETGLPYELVRVDWRAGALQTDEFKRINPMMKIPALQDGGICVAETGAIAAYLAEKSPQSGLAPPLGDPRRGRFWQWLFFGGNCIEPAVAQLFLKFEISPGSAAWGDAGRVFAVLEQALEPGPWILGADFCVADVVLGNYLRFVIEVFKILPANPVFAGYLERCKARPAFQRAWAIEQAG
jgi:glutathione S-transferase